MLQDTVVVVNHQQIHTRLDDEVVILDMKSGTYYGLNTVGTRVWELMQQPVTFSQIHETLLAEYDVDPEECRQDITTLLEDLINRGMVEVRDNSGA
jgi:hypothetical protein